MFKEIKKITGRGGKPIDIARSAGRWIRWFR